MKKKEIFLISILIVFLILGFTPIVAKGEEESSSTSIPALYAGTSDPGYVYKYTGGTSWDLISPSLGYAVLCLVEYEGHLYAGTMSNQPTSGVGKVWRYDGGMTWTLVGDNLDDQVCALAVYNGDLYAGTAWGDMKLYKYNGDTTWTLVVSYTPWTGTRALYESHGYLLMGDIGYDRFGRWDGTNFYADLHGGGCCIYDYQDFNGYVYGSAYYGRLWQSSDAISWSTILGYDYGKGNIWELEEFQSQLYMSYNNGELRSSGFPVDRGTLVYPAPDGIISMTTDTNNLYFGTGGEAGGSYGSSVAGIANVYKYDGISSPTLISGWDQFIGGVQVLYIEPRSIDKTLNPTEGALGDTIHITLEVNVPSGENVIVTDYLPEGFEYIKGTFTIDGTPAGSKVKKGVLTYDVLDYGTHILEFDVKIDHAKNWEELEVCNVASASWYLNEILVDESEDSEEFSILPFEDLQKYIGLPKADVVFSFDLTGSMGGAIGQAKSQATTIINNLQSLISDIGFGVVTHVDYPHTYYNYYGYSAQYGSPSTGDYAYNTDLDITEDPALAISTITGLTLRYGGDGPQDYSRVLYESQYLSWREDSTKILVLFGDNIPHDNDFWYYSTGGDPGPDELQETSDDIDFQTVVTAVASQEITILAIDCSGGYYAGFYQYMADHTGGQYFMLGTSGVADVIYEMVKAEAMETLTIMTGTETQWALVMEVTNSFSYTMTNTRITDRFGAEIEIDEPFPSTITHGTVSYTTKGKSEKVFLTWDIGDLLPGETARLILLVSTDLNPAGHQEYTSSGVHELNSGATLKFIDPEQDMQLSAVTDSIDVEVYDVIIF